MSGVLQVVVAGIGLLGPGLPGWAGGQAALRDTTRWQMAPTAVPAPGRLPATERRRAGAGVKAAILVADEAVAAADADPALLATVFTSSTGDPLNCHLLCEALAAPERRVSPTRFTNSVHNAPAGYWHIATHSMQPSTSLCGHDASFAAGLLEAAAQCMASGRPVLLVACDVPYPEPLHSLRPVPDSFALALLLAPLLAPATAGNGRLLSLRCIAAGAAPTACAHAGLETLRRAIPAARALPLLLALAGDAAASVVVECQSGTALMLDLAAR